jgi:CBS domain containing-hemolysin-like protein
MINLKDLERKLDDALSKESPETLTSFIIEKRQKMKNVKDKIKAKIWQQGGTQLLNELWLLTSRQVHNEVRNQVKNRARYIVWQPVAQNIKL